MYHYTHRTAAESPKIVTNSKQDSKQFQSIFMRHKKRNINRETTNRSIDDRSFLESFFLEEAVSALGLLSRDGMEMERLDKIRLNVDLLFPDSLGSFEFRSRRTNDNHQIKTLKLMVISSGS